MEARSNLFLRKKVESENEEDAWDDTKLVKAYDKAVSKAKQQILKKIQTELGLTNAEIQEVFSDTSSSKKKKKKKKKNKISEKKIKWEVGSACRAIYSVDGEEYEAEIISMIDPNWCKVKFIGYDNEEEVPLQELTPSLGKNVVKLQLESAELFNAALEETEMETEKQDVASNLQQKSEVSFKNSYPKMSDSYPKMSDSYTKQQRPPMFQRFAPPPPPPPQFGPAPFTSDSFANPVGCAFPPMRDEPHNSMLLSWFMCGYYTGYYQRDLEVQQDPPVDPAFSTNN